jgi:putative metallopeptidase-like protein
VPTAAVVAAGDGTCLLLYNPAFFVAIGAGGVRFVLFHEARHLIHRHLYADETLRTDPVFDLAAEVSINHVAVERLRQQLPTREVPDGRGGTRREKTGIDPRDVHARYQADLGEQGLDPLDYADFVRTDMTVYGELRRMRNPPVPPPQICVHLTSGGSGGELAGGVPMDPETVGLVVEEALSQTMRAALRRGGLARDEILAIADRSGSAGRLVGERLGRMWSRLGLSALRGETPRTRRVEWWKRWLTDTLASRLRDGERLIYPKKQGAVLLALGHEPMLSRRGAERTKVVVVALDTSGSMPQQVVDWITSLVGTTDGVQSHWLSFDGTVLPFVPGERVHGGGGTDFQHVVDYVEGRLEIDGKRFEESPDAVIMVTDGYAPHVTPARPDRWIWLITDGGDDWPERHEPPMACHRVITGDG